METFKNAEGKRIVEDLVATIIANTAYLSEVDGAIGDGDHGINMNKGFTLCGEALAGVDLSFTEATLVLGKTLLLDIGGSMGPLYGSFFKGIAKAGAATETIDAATFAAMMEAGLAALRAIGKGEVGDKTLLDTLIPAVTALRGAVDGGAPFSEALDRMSAAAEAGMLSTKDLVARIGRASRLGERSRGVLDAGAVSSCLILQSMARSIRGLLHP